MTYISVSVRSTSSPYLNHCWIIIFSQIVIEFENAVCINFGHFDPVCHNVLIGGSNLWCTTKYTGHFICVSILYFVAHTSASTCHYTIVSAIHELSNKSSVAAYDCRNVSAFWLIWAIFLFWRPFKLRTNLKKYRGIGELECRKRLIWNIHSFN